MREFPSLYQNSHKVIMACIVGRQGYPKWTEDGLIEDTDTHCHYDKETKTFGPYPLVISEEVAEDFYLQYQGKTVFPHDINGIINEIPMNAHEDWLDEIDMFLYHYEKYTPDFIQKLSEVQTFLHYGTYINPHAGQPHRYISDMTKFVNKVPSWRARIREIEYFKQVGKIDPATYIGMHI